MIVEFILAIFLVIVVGTFFFFLMTVREVFFTKRIEKHRKDINTTVNNSLFGQKIHTDMGKSFTNILPYYSSTPPSPKCNNSKFNKLMRRSKRLHAILSNGSIDWLIR